MSTLSPEAALTWIWKEPFSFSFIATLSPLAASTLSWILCLSPALLLLPAAAALPCHKLLKSLNIHLKYTEVRRTRPHPEI